MSKVQPIIEDLQARGYSDRDILAALEDGEAIGKLGLGDEDQADIKAAYSRIFDRVFPEVAVSASRKRDEERTDDEREDARARAAEAKLRYSIKGDL